MDGRRPGMAHSTIPECLSRINTPLVVEEWERLLNCHPDREYGDYLLRGMKEGFRIGFRYADCAVKRAGSNMKSASDHPEVVEQYLATEVKLGRVIILDREALPACQVSRFGVIPKSQPGRWRLIVDLSHPKGASVNDGIESELCSLSYTSVDAAVRIITAMGPGVRLAKFDIESAYRLIPVHPDDRPLLGMMWRDKFYVDTALPFGLRSAPKIFNAVADALQWIMERNGVPELLHYLDDFLIFGGTESLECQQALEKALQLCLKLGVPVAKSKTEGPATNITFLGIELDTTAMIVRLPREKLHRLQREICKWTGRRSCSKRELLSIIGQLQHACCVVKPGRSFLRRMISLSTVAKELHHRIRLNRGFRSDLQWWASFLPSWNGVSMMSGVVPAYPSASITSDASGSWGCGAFSSAGDWFQLKWPESWSEVHITVKELLPIIMGVALWGRSWQGRTIRCRCDNMAVVAILKSGSSKDERVMHLMRSLFFFLASYVILLGEHIPGVENGAADALSRDNRPSFLTQVPTAHREPTVIPQELVQALVINQTGHLRVGRNC